MTFGLLNENGSAPSIRRTRLYRIVALDLALSSAIKTFYYIYRTVALLCRNFSWVISNGGKIIVLTVLRLLGLWWAQQTHSDEKIHLSVEEVQLTCCILLGYNKVEAHLAFSRFGLVREAVER